MFAPKKILVPTNLYEESDPALKEAVDIASQYDSKIYLLHVVDGAIYRRLIQNGVMQEELFDRIMAMRTENLQEMIRRQKETYVPARSIEIIPDIQVGQPSEVIVREQKKKGADLVVLGSRKKQGWIGQLLTNVADRVVRSASFPALVVTH